MKHLIGSLKSGNWKALLACFLYFDTGFTTWVMFGPLAPFISKQLTLTPTQAGFLVAVPVLLTSETHIDHLVEMLEVRFLANRDPNLAFALIGDYRDAPEQPSKK